MSLAEFHGDYLYLNWDEKRLLLKFSAKNLEFVRTLSNQQRAASGKNSNHPVSRDSLSLRLGRGSWGLFIWEHKSISIGEPKFIYRLESQSLTGLQQNRATISPRNDKTHLLGFHLLLRTGIVMVGWAWCQISVITLMILSSWEHSTKGRYHTRLSRSPKFFSILDCDAGMVLKSN